MKSRKKIRTTTKKKTRTTTLADDLILGIMSATAVRMFHRLLTENPKLGPKTRKAKKASKQKARAHDR